MSHYPSPDDILNELGITEPDEIDIEAIACHHGAFIKYGTLHGCAGRILGSDKKAIITVDNNCPHGRQRFSAGHEVGHWIRDRGKAFHCTSFDMSSFGYGQDPESLANQFSADLLMPKFMFQPRTHNRDITFKTAGDLANEFQVSNTAAALRLIQFGSFPAMIVCHGRNLNKNLNRWKWFRRGNGVPETVWPCDELSHETAAFEVLFGSAHPSRPVKTSADKWIKHRDSRRYHVIEDSIKTSDDEVVTLIWWKDKSQLLNL